MRRLKYFFIITIPAFLVGIVFLELVFRFVIPASNIPYYYYDPEQQVLRFDVDKSRAGTYTMGNLAQQRARWHVNNFGWNSDIDYVSEMRIKPLIAVIGDSYVEALHVDADENVASLLREKIGDDFDVYSFGVSRAPISGYLQISRYVNEHFNPDVLVFNVVHNDFDESLCKVSTAPGLMCLQISEDKVTEAEIIAYVPNQVKRLSRMSGLVRYVFLNLKVQRRLGRAQKGNQDQDNNTLAAVSTDPQTDRIERATDYVLQKIASENAGKTVIFMIDGPRTEIYEGNIEGSKNLWMNRLLEGQTGSYGFHFIDLTESFAEEFARNSNKFENRYDYHWNENGHAVASEALLKMLRQIGAVE